MFLVHRRELVKQTVDTLYETVPRAQIGTIVAGQMDMPWLPLQVGMVQTIVRRPKVANYDLIIIDEAHHARASSWEKVLNMWPKAKRIGLTATPERLDGKGLGEHFAEMVLGPTIPELVDMGWLAPTKVLRIPSGLMLDGLRKDKNGDYRQADVAERITGTVIASAVDSYQRYARGRPAIFFGVHRDHSRRVCAELHAQGVRARHVDGTDSNAYRDRIMNELRTGGLDVVGNCDLISEGFDAPRCDVVMMGSPTRSATRYLQQAGRAMRPGKDKMALILDLAGISHELGLPDDAREWSLEDGEIRDGKKAHATPRDCPRCYTVFWGRICPTCQHASPLAEVPEVDTELEEAKGAAPLKRGRRSEVWREMGMAKRAPDPAKALAAIAERRGYKIGWVKHILHAWQMAK